MVLSFIFYHVICTVASALYSYGTTGLLNMPTTGMQRDKTFMFGGAYLEKTYIASQMVL